MHLTKALEEITKIQSKLRTEFASKLFLVLQQGDFSTQSRNGVILFIIQSDIPRKEMQGLSETEIIQFLTNQIQHSEYLFPENPKFTSIFNSILSNINSNHPLPTVLQILEEIQQNLTSNCWNYNNGVFSSVEKENPGIIFNTYVTPSHFATMIQIVNLQRMSQEKSHFQPESTLDPRIHQLEEENRQLKEKIAHLEHEREVLLAIGSEKETEIQMLKHQLDLHVNSYEEQIEMQNGKIQELLRERTQMIAEIEELRKI